MSDKKLFIVDTLLQFRVRYVIEAESLEHAYDEVTMRDSGNPDDLFEEFSQRHLGEVIIDGREIKRKHLDIMTAAFEADEDELCSTWMGDALIRKVDYGR
jgi:hypothetical protein